MKQLPEKITLSPNSSVLEGSINLGSSKSISNRALTILALAGARPDLYLKNLSTAEDTQLLAKLLSETTDTYDAGEAGTVYRFMTAFLALQPEEQVLTGSDRMKERPIGPLVDGLRHLGADISYLGKKGYPPLRIGDGWRLGLEKNQVHLAADISSQFLSALAMLGPMLPHGLLIRPEGKIVSRPYLDMTLSIMDLMGATWEWSEGLLFINRGSYRPTELVVEADWSSASYWYVMAVFSDSVDLTLEGLQPDSWQGDSRIAQVAEHFGVHTAFTEKGVRMTRTEKAPPPVLEYDFSNCPDLFPAVSVMCAGLGVQALFSGLESLRIKESDRINSMKTELAKVGVHLSKLPPKFNKKKPDVQFYMQDGKASLEQVPSFDTWNDHRIAMAMACLGAIGQVRIQRPEVVKKSYPGYWADMEKVGFAVE